MVKILYEDDNYIILVKPAGMPIHPSKLHMGDTLADNLAGRLDVFRCINRLDRVTEGLTIVAKTKDAAAYFYKLMTDRKIEREYEAIVENGDERLPDSGTIDAPIARLSEDERDIRRTVDYEKGESAVTHYRVIETGENYTRVNLKLETGRTHQIRVHMAYIGHPLKGDNLYNPKAGADELAALKAVRLRFPDMNGEMKEFSLQ